MQVVFNGTDIAIGGVVFGACSAVLARRALQAVHLAQNVVLAVLDLVPAGVELYANHNRPCRIQ